MTSNPPINPIHEAAFRHKENTDYAFKHGMDKLYRPEEVELLIADAEQAAYWTGNEHGFYGASGVAGIAQKRVQGLYQKYRDELAKALPQQVGEERQ